MTLKEHNAYLSEIKNGTHKQFYFDKEKQKIMCKCGSHAVWFRNEGYLCSSITVKSNCKY
jgi:hypothetical protein